MLCKVTVIVRYIPESPRWLLVQNKMGEAMIIIRKIAVGNGKTVPQNVLAKEKVRYRYSRH